jgi:hypothetical protein
MKVIKTESSITGIPDYYQVYVRWLARYSKSGDNGDKVRAYHYARVAEELGQAEIEDDTTQEALLEIR